METKLIYKNKKKGTLYSIIGLAIDATNSRDGTKVIVYKSCDDGALYVREEDEFVLKFEMVGIVEEDNVR